MVLFRFADPDIAREHVRSRREARVFTLRARALILGLSRASSRPRGSRAFPCLATERLRATTRLTSAQTRCPSARSAAHHPRPAALPSAPTIFGRSPLLPSPLRSVHDTDARTFEAPLCDPRYARAAPPPPRRTPPHPRRAHPPLRTRLGRTRRASALHRAAPRCRRALPTPLRTHCGPSPPSNRRIGPVPDRPRFVLRAPPPFHRHLPSIIVGDLP